MRLNSIRLARLTPLTAAALVAAYAVVGCGDDSSGTGNPGTGGGGNAGGTAGGGNAGGTAGGGNMGGVGGSGNMGGSGAVGGTAGSGGSGGGGPNMTACVTTSDGTSGLLLKGTVLAPDQKIDDGEVLIDGNGIIQCVAADCSGTAGAGDATVITCDNGVISPGLINTHDHISFARTPPTDFGTERFDHRHDWRKGLRGHNKLQLAGTAGGAEILAAELRFVMSGTTSTISAGGRRGLLRNLDGQDKEGLNTPTVNSDTFPLDDNDGIYSTSGCNYGSNPTTASDVASEHAYVPHIAEGIDAEAQNEVTCTTTTYDVVEPQTAIVHAIAVGGAEVAEFAAERSWVVWSPRSNVALYGNTAPVTLLDNMGVGIALGTDWLASGSMNMSRELRCADELNKTYYNNHFSDEEIWRMATLNAAFVAGVENGLGALKVGYTADIAIFNSTNHKDYRAVIDAEPADVALVLRGGEALYGDKDLLNNTVFDGSSCEAIDVCMTDKLACVSRDTSNTLAELMTEGGAVAELFNCGGAPAVEPSCVPFRDGEYDGVATATDKDADGIDDAMDLCPDIFDPIRPMDGSAQADADNDGKGDACDPCPNDNTDACSAADANDVDNDGEPNTTDNCPDDSNADQMDGDGDGKGDACDVCPTSANPGFEICAGPPVDIKDIRDPSSSNPIAENSPVTLEDMYVVGVDSTGSVQGYYAQKNTDLYTGIFVFTKNVTPNVQVGNKVNISGTYVEFNDLSEITDPVTTVTDSGTTLPFAPIALDPETLATAGSNPEPYESMLVEIANVKVSVMNSDGPADDFDEFTVITDPGGTVGYRVNDTCYDALDNTYPVDTVFTKIVGVQEFSFGNFKIAPRSATDLTQ